MSRRLLAICSLTAFALAGTWLDARQHKHKKHDDQAQTPRPAGFILGQVSDAATGRPVSGATVTLSADSSGDGPMLPPSALPRVLTGDDGRFLFRSLTAGRYRVTATAPGYLDGAVGQHRAEGTAQTLEVDDGQRIGTASIRLWPEATIAGAVVDETGAPVPNLWVGLLRRDPASADGAAIREVVTTRTDDLGAYRLSGIAPGAYVVGVPSRVVQDAAPNAAAVRIGDVLVQPAGTNVLAGRLPYTRRDDGRIVGYASTYHPTATAIASATWITVAAGDRRDGVDIQLRPMLLSRVSGTVLGPGGAEAGINVALIPSYAAGQVLERTHGTATAQTGAKGAFTFPIVPPGSYVLRAWRHPQILVIGNDALPPDASLWNETAVVVGDSPIDGLSVQLRPGATVSGRVRFEGSATLPMPVRLQTALSVAFEPPWILAFGARMATRVTSSFEFVTQGLPPGRYFANLPNNFTDTLRGWYFESAVHEGRDLTRTPLVLDGASVGGLDIVFSDRRTEVSGTVVDAAGRPATDGAVVLFPVDFAAWIADGLSPLAAYAQRVTDRGGFGIQIRPGDYFVAAIGDDMITTWRAPRAIEAMAAVATKVSIARGENRRVDLRRR